MFGIDKIIQALHEGVESVKALFNNLSIDSYRNALIGINNTDKPGLRGAIFSQSTEDAIIKVVKYCARNETDSIPSL